MPRHRSVASLAEQRRIALVTKDPQLGDPKTMPQQAPRPTSAPPWTPTPCKTCAGAGIPYMVETIPHSKQIRVAVRCATCRHEWELRLTVNTL